MRVPTYTHAERTVYSVRRLCEMTDKLTKQARSALMSRVRQAGTTPEVRLRKRLHAMGLRYTMNSDSLPGRPDLALPRYRVVVFVHGCFWHGHSCRAGRSSSSNQDYWTPKLTANKLRDERKKRELLDLGWRVLTVWECGTKGTQLDRTASAAAEYIRNGLSCTMDLSRST